MRRLPAAQPVSAARQTLMGTPLVPSRSVRSSTRYSALISGPVVTGAEGDESEARPHGWDYFRHGDQESLCRQEFIGADLRRKEKDGMKNSG